MEKNEFCFYRRKLGKTQQELADILGMSLKTVHSYEQGLRTIPPHIARYFYFLILNQRHENVTQEHEDKPPIPCWEKKPCLQKENCPAWEFNCGHLCWFISGTRCEKSCGEEDHKRKLDSCKTCAIFKKLFEEQ